MRVGVQLPVLLGVPDRDEVPVPVGERVLVAVPEGVPLRVRVGVTVPVFVGVCVLELVGVCVAVKVVVAEPVGPAETEAAGVGVRQPLVEAVRDPLTLAELLLAAEKVGAADAEATTDRLTDALGVGQPVVLTVGVVDHEGQAEADGGVLAEGCALALWLSREDTVAAAEILAAADTEA